MPDGDASHLIPAYRASYSRPDKALAAIRRIHRRNSGGDFHALAFKADGLPGDNFAAFTSFNRAIDLDQPVGNSDFRLSAAFAPAFQLEQIA
ncbi:hypothetical protein SARI_02414 [Salmonella enterica subsp. arizonae serovar 62:z4,z23:-]|uniref:Uncharacterized protein n=1 Tax=Salmonella arizonae (strain ATCC BAA-731 / CDC346-86 / RSK2980) TaxID=41514 RepID=A9MLA6_SALAR|nr:hypothetical protein SARI_02414 [Salmonella enterica subsp. arizonae serovar 62:z4,z23:-]